MAQRDAVGQYERMLSVDSADWEALRQLLIRKAFFAHHEGRSLRDRNGAVVPWLYHGSEVFLSAEGLGLAGSVLSSRLAVFGDCQLATYGTSAIPLLAVCLAGGLQQGGIVIRKQRENHGIARLLEGPVAPGLPVVVVDDSLSSGRSLRAAFGALEAAGLPVLGAVCLVEFSGYGAREWLTARGYRVETVYDVWHDLERTGVAAADEPVHAASWSARTVPPGLTAAAAARCVAVELLNSGRLLRPPDRLDKSHDAGGGTFVSMRRRRDDVRVARSGFRRDGVAPDPGTDVVLATERAVAAANLRTAADLQAIKFAVTFVSAPRVIGPDQIEPDRRALSVRGLGPLARTGFALPNAPHYDDEIQQLRYARSVGGSFSPLEPIELVDHGVERSIEPGETWPVYGAAAGEPDWARSSTLAVAVGAVLRHALRSLAGESTGTAPLCPTLPEPFSSVGVSLYRSGLVGCGMSSTPDLAAAVREAAAVAWSDQRYPLNAATQVPAALTGVVTVLIRPRALGAESAMRLPLFYRLGRDTLQADSGSRRGVVLAHFAAQQSLSERAYQEQVLVKAGLTESPDVTWTACETIGWVVTDDRERPLELGYPDRRDRDQPDPMPPEIDRHALELARRIAGFILGGRLADGLPGYRLSPWSAQVTSEGTTTRVLIAATALAEAAPLLGGEFGAAADEIAEAFIRDGGLRAPRSGLTWDTAAEAQLVQLLTALEPRPDRNRIVELLARRLRGLVRPDGALFSGSVRIDADLDLLSGSVLLALARADAWLGDSLTGIDLSTVLRFAQRRFRLSHPWGMVWWHAQAWAALARDDRRPFTDFVLEIVDWALARQSRVSGAFVIEDMEPRRESFLSACVLEGVAEGWAVAQKRGDVERAKRCADSWRRGIRFLDRLTLHAEDVYFCPEPAAVVGGVRVSLPSSDLRIDVAGHALRALVAGLRVLAQPQQNQNAKAGSGATGAFSATETARPI
jgi:orotate phosphoribosyltransferase